MKTLKNPALLLMALAAVGLLAGGCESDSVAPHDELPALDAQDVATQAGAVAYATTYVAPYLNDTGAGKVMRTNTFNGEHGLTGAVMVDFRDGPDGASAEPSAAAWAHLYTEAPVLWETQLGGQTEFTLDVAATLTRDPDTATILAGSGGGFVSGDYSASFTMDGIVVRSDSDYPTAGMLTLTGGEHEAIVTFNGSNMVLVIVDSVRTFTVNLDTGVVTEEVPI